MSHPTVSEIRDEILAKCQDSSFVLAWILKYLNDAQKEISGRVQLPALIATGTVTTSTTYNYVAMPTTTNPYQRNLYKCHSSTNNRWVTVYESLADLERNFSDLTQTGNVVGVAVNESYLYYQRNPATAESLTLYYLKQPTDLTILTSTPSEIPQEYAKVLLVNYALRQIFIVKAAQNPAFLQVADGYDDEFEKYMGKLSAFLGSEKRPAIEVPDEIGWDSLC